MNHETVIETQPKIAEYLGISTRTLSRRVPEMKRVGILFYKIRRAKNGGKEKICYTFPSLLQRFEILRNYPDQK
jgi:predicted transcriptional regulator